MKIIIKNKNIYLENKKYANTYFKELRGLMFNFNKNFDYALIFDREFESRYNSSIHMFFVFFKIHVIFLDKNKQIVDIKKNLKPFSMYVPKKSRYIIEISSKHDISKFKKGYKVVI